jgi:uncharacterized membrane protein YccC
MTSGIVLPAFLMGYFNMLQTGIVVSLGALLVSVTDNPGPIITEEMECLVSIASIFLITFLTALALQSQILLLVLLVIATFIYSMISVYGARAGAIGTASIIMLTLTIDPRQDLSDAGTALTHSLYIASGGLWYLCYSMLLYNFKPFRVAQQAVGSYIQATADYLLVRSELYKRNINYDNTYKKILQQQILVQQKQNELSELLFKTRSIVKESTIIGRTLVMMHLDVVDMFEKIMSSYQKYSLLHEYFDETDILDDIHALAGKLAFELNEIGIAVKSGEPSKPSGNFENEINSTVEKLNQLRHTYLKPDNIEGFISLSKIIDNIKDLSLRLNVLHKYTTYNESFSRKQIKERGYEDMISSQRVSPALFLDNLSFNSDTFRHSIRVSIAMLVGFLVADFFNVGHSYWVLLTIIVIMKPAYSLAKKRNMQRIAGTVAGIVIGVLIVNSTKNDYVLFGMLIILMAGSFSTMRVDYFISVTLMTPYLVLFYHLLSPENFRVLLTDRIVDTLIGSAIAFAASFSFFLHGKEIRLSL